jgi:hypothetical protein
LALAGAAYFLGNEKTTVPLEGSKATGIISGYSLWPWGAFDWKPRELRRDLVRGCALGIAGGELADRNSKQKRRSF